jgi:hypothetical protein
MRVRLTQIDGKMPNLALMKLSHWHKARGDEVVFTRQAHRDVFESDYDVVYGSAIFEFSAPKIARFLADWPCAILGGSYDKDNKRAVEDITGLYDGLDYSLYPDFKPSIGYTQRGCRFKCGFCSVPIREGKARSVNVVAGIWRGTGHPKQLHLLDNDFFGQPKHEWTARLTEMRDGGFRVCFNQGINIRVITDEIARAIASVEYRDDKFKERRLYTAWDSLGDEMLFFRGVKHLEDAGIPPKHLRVYMLIGWDPDEQERDILYRFNAMADLGIEPYPMVYDCRATDLARYRRLKQVQRWAVTGLYRAIPFSDYDSSAKSGRGPDMRQFGLFEEAAS